MTDVFATILNMSLTASIIICVVLLVRLCLRKAPKIYSYILWSVVLFRLLCPVSISLPVSILAPAADTSAAAGTSYTSSMEYIPTSRNEYVTKQDDVPMQNVQPQTAGNSQSSDVGNNTGTFVAEPSDISAPASAMSVKDIILMVFGWIWVAGIAVFLGITAWQNARLRSMLATACIIRGNVYESDNIENAFVLGVFSPKIYLPTGLSFDVQKAVLAHEQTHQRRGDHIVKAVSYLALALHWFNPLVWLSFKLMCDDMEKSCDEAVLRNMHDRGYTMKSIKRAYGQMLFALGSGRQHLFSPVSFAENSTKSRIKNVVGYSKVTRNVGIALCVVCGLVIGLCLINPTGAAAASENDAIISGSDAREQDEAVMLTIGGVTFRSDVTELDLSDQNITDISDLRYCTNLRSLTLSGNEITDYSPLLYCDTITEIYLSDADRENIFEDYVSVDAMSVFSELPNLKVLEIASIENESIDVLSDFSSLEYFTVYGNILRNDGEAATAQMRDYYGDDRAGVLSVLNHSPKSIKGFGFCIPLFDIAVIESLQQYPELNMLDCSDVSSFDSSGKEINHLSDVSRLINLEELCLKLSNDSDLSFISGMRALNKLTVFALGGELSVDLSGITNCNKLKDLQLIDCGNISPIYGLMNLEHLYISGSNVDISQIHSEETLLTLELVAVNVVHPEKMSKFKNLEALTLWTYDDTELDLQTLENMTNLRILSLQIGEIYNIDAIKNATRLQKLMLSSNRSIEFEFLENMVDMEFLQLTCPDGLTDLSFINHMDNIQTLILEGNFLDISSLSDKRCLVALHITSPKLEDISPIEKCDSLTDLSFRDCSSLEDVSSLDNIISLKTLSFVNTPIYDISFVRELPVLISLDLYYTNVTDISPLYDVGSLNWFRYYNGGEGESAHIRQLQQLNPNCEIYTIEGIG